MQTHMTGNAHRRRRLHRRANWFVVLFAMGCSPERSPPISDHVRIPPVSRMDGVTLGMDAEEFRALYPRLNLARYEGYSDSTAALKATFVFTDPCTYDSTQEEDCPVRGRLQHVDVLFAWERAGGQTLFVETWGEFFNVFREPVYCHRYDTRYSEGGSSPRDGGAVVAHWDDDSGLWATLTEHTVPRLSPDSAQTSYRIGWGRHSHVVTEAGLRGCEAGA